MRTIWKYPLVIGRNAIDCPEPATPLHVGVDPMGEPCVWVMVDNVLPVVRDVLRIELVGTGHAVGEGKHLGSFNSGPFVWHAFEVTA